MHDFLDNLGAQQYEKYGEKCHQGRTVTPAKKPRKEKCHEESYSQPKKEER